MANLKEVKNRISSVISTQQITKAMKMVAAAKLRKAQDRIVQMRPYSEKLTAILQNVSSNTDDEMANAFAQQRETEKVLLVVVTSDRGLCGAFNSNVFRKTNQLIQEKYQDVADNGNLSIMPIGKRSLDYFKKKDFPIINQYAHAFGQLSFDSVKPAAEHVMEAFLSAEFDQVEIIYNEFKNIATQIIRSEQFLPVLPAEQEEQQVSGEVMDYIYEPSQDFILQEIIPKSLKIQFYKTLLESNASEHGARMTAMDKATENAGELLKELRLSYNRTRQAAITTEILEIVAGAEALKSN